MPFFGIIAAVAAPLIIGAVNSSIQNGKARGMTDDIQTAKGNVDNIMRDRAAVYDASGRIRDMKSMVTNPYANLGIATKAAEIQMEQTDQALANTLDTLTAGGMGAGGATALAMAANRSKKEVAANIEQQEVQNEKLYAQGEQQVNQQLMNLESSAIAAEERAAAGQDARVQAELDRSYGEYDALRSRQMGLEDSADASFMAGLSGATSVLSASAGNFKKP